ncbi:TrbI F-type domain-containing protein [Alteraurantiacibacter buctensis]|uniref:Type-F conjugative transfer system protein TrbI n=1 Tax=Alteraurantiacibacter buctensis TaxID=1503981 RepID=A0A844YZ83_9SPHN|nr:TrbI F-type domain-containing protein [Alteraurantiacibacter buctensis]MXO71774.1 hypothetical protein [Alteraurantiacibacter buctensis]
MTDLLRIEPRWAKRSAVILGTCAVLVWGGWITHEVTANRPPELVTVRLAETMASFVDEAARADADPAEVQAASLAYLRAAEAAVAAMDGKGRVVLVAEAVLAGEAVDATPELERRISEELKKDQRP